MRLQHWWPNSSIRDDRPPDHSAPPSLLAGFYPSPLPVKLGTEEQQQNLLEGNTSRSMEKISRSLQTKMTLLTPKPVKQAWRLLCSPLPGTHFHRSTRLPHSKEPGRSGVLHAGLGSKLRNHGKAGRRAGSSGANSSAAETEEVLKSVKNTNWLPPSGQIRGMIYVKQGRVSSCESLGFYRECVISWVQFWFVFCVCA